MEYLPNCDGCKYIYSLRNEPTPCNTCVIESFPENEDALLIYSIVRWQTITTEVNNKKFVDINISAIKDAMDILGIEYKKSTVLKVLKLFNHFIGNIS